MIIDKSNYNTSKHACFRLEEKHSRELAELEAFNELKLDSLKRENIELAIWFLRFSDTVKQKSINIFHENNYSDQCFIRQYELLFNFREIIKSVFDKISVYDCLDKKHKRQDVKNLRPIYEKALDKQFTDVYNSYVYKSDELSYYDLQNKLQLDIQLIIDAYYSFCFWHLYSTKYLLLED